MSSITVGQLIALLSQHDPALPVVTWGEGYASVEGSAKVMSFVPVSSCYKDFDEAGEYESRGGVNCHPPTGPAFDALFIA